MCYYTWAVGNGSPIPGCSADGSALEWGSRGRWFKSSHSDQNAEISNDFSVFFIGYNIPVLVYFLSVLIFYTSSGIFQKNHLTFLPERV